MAAIPNRLRFEVFQRDGFRCVYCGRSASETTLNADHVAPVAKGGATDADNLATACEACNNGKGARDVLPAVPLGAGLVGQWLARFDDQGLMTHAGRVLAKVDGDVYRVGWVNWLQSEMAGKPVIDCTTLTTLADLQDAKVQLYPNLQLLEAAVERDNRRVNALVEAA